MTYISAADSIKLDNSGFTYCRVTLWKRHHKRANNDKRRRVTRMTALESFVHTTGRDQIFRAIQKVVVGILGMPPFPIRHLTSPEEKMRFQSLQLICS
jgi:hypothetical protein